MARAEGEMWKVDGVGMKFFYYMNRSEKMIALLGDEGLYDVFL